MKMLAALVVVVLLAAGGAAYWEASRVREPYRGYPGDSALVAIAPGSSTRAIGDSLIDAGVVRDRTVFRLALWWSGDARRLQAGDYRFDAPMTPLDVIGKIVRGEVDRLPITFPEGLTIREMAAIVAEQGLGTEASFIAAARNASLIQDVDPTARTLEGYLFPDTYSVPRTTDAEKLVKLMVDRFKQALTPALRESAAANGRTIRQLVTLASIVEKETGRAEERPLIAAVYANRLRIGMGLQCDPTVIYALQLAGKFNGNLRREDLQYDSPYNTYRYPGLPPGPIASPGQAALEAAAKPADVEYLYFVSRNDGSHEFAKTLDEHNRNVQRFQVQYFRDQRRAARR